MSKRFEYDDKDENDDVQIKRVKHDELKDVLTEDKRNRSIDDILMIICMKGISNLIKLDNQNEMTLSERIISIRNKTLDLYADHVKIYHVYETIVNKQYGVLFYILRKRPEFYNFSLCTLYDDKKLKVIDRLYEQIRKDNIKVKPYINDWYNIYDEEEIDENNVEYCFLTKLVKDKSMDLYDKFNEFYDDFYIPEETLFVYFCKYGLTERVEKSISSIIDTSSYSSCMFISLTEALKHKHLNIAKIILDVTEKHKLRIREYKRIICNEEFKSNPLEICVEILNEENQDELLSIMNRIINIRHTEDSNREHNQMIKHAESKALDLLKYAIFKHICTKKDRMFFYIIYMFYIHWNGKDDIKVLELKEEVLTKYSYYKFNGLCCNSKINTLEIIKKMPEKDIKEFVSRSEWMFSNIGMSGNYLLAEYLRNLSGQTYNYTFIINAFENNHIQLVADIFNNHNKLVADIFRLRTLTRVIDNRIISLYSRLNEEGKLMLVRILEHMIPTILHCKIDNSIARFLFSLINFFDGNIRFTLSTLFHDMYIDKLAYILPFDRYMLVVKEYTIDIYNKMNGERITQIQIPSYKKNDIIIMCLNKGIDIRCNEVTELIAYKKRKLDILREIKVNTRSDDDHDYYNLIPEVVIHHISKFVEH